MKTLNLLFVLISVLINISYGQLDPTKRDPIILTIPSETAKEYLKNRSEHETQILNKDAEVDDVIWNMFQDTLESILIENEIMGASTAIFMPDKGMFINYAGMSDPDENIPINPDMLFDIGSNTKTFISAMMLLLQEDGLLSLDDSIYQWLPNFTNIDSTITIRQLLNHTGGISCYINENAVWWDSIWVDHNRYWSPEYSLSFVLEPNFAPGTSWSYSNTGYILAGMIIKEATGSSNVAPLLRDRILYPLNLNSTFLDIEEVIIGELVHGWYTNSSGNTMNYYPTVPRTAFYSSAWTCGAMVSTSENMARWVRALYSGQVINQASLNEMFTLIPGWLDGCGLGTWKYTYLNTEFWAHTGLYMNGLSCALYAPQLDICIIALINHRIYPDEYWLDDIFKAYFDRIMYYYNYPYDKVHAYDVNVSTPFIHENQDNLIITSQINNPNECNIEAYAYISNRDSSYIDSIALFDDGLHNDSLPGDGFYGRTIDAFTVEDEFSLTVNTYDLDSGYYHISGDTARFTSIGPLVYENHSYNQSDTLPNPGDLLYIYFTLKNEGSTASADNVEAKLISLDTLVYTNSSFLSFGDIAPGEMKTNVYAIGVIISENCPVNAEIPIGVDIMSNGYTFWSDTFSIIVTDPVSIEEPENLSSKSIISQNYPNPFQSKTIFSYNLALDCNVELSIYNINGQQITTLISEKKPKGEHELEWDAQNISNGVYYYIFKAGDFIQTRKLLLIK